MSTGDKPTPCERIPGACEYCHVESDCCGDCRICEEEAREEEELGEDWEEA